MSFIQIARDLCGTRGDREALHRPIAPVGHSLRVLFVNNLERGETFSRFFIQKNREKISKVPGAIHTLARSH